MRPLLRLLLLLSALAGLLAPAAALGHAVLEQSSPADRAETDGGLITSSAAVVDGRVFTGHQALPLKLIDQIGDERAARAWLEKARKINASLPVQNYRLHSRLYSLPFLHAAATAMLHGVGLDSFAERLGALGSAAAFDGFNLDGLLALWQPADTK